MSPNKRLKWTGLLTRVLLYRFLAEFVMSVVIVRVACTSFLGVFCFHNDPSYCTDVIGTVTLTD